MYIQTTYIAITSFSFPVTHRQNAQCMQPGNFICVQLPLCIHVSGHTCTCKWTYMYMYMYSMTVTGHVIS